MQIEIGRWARWTQGTAAAMTTLLGVALAWAELLWETLVAPPR